MNKIEINIVLTVKNLNSLKTKTKSQFKRSQILFKNKKLVKIMLK